jgi:vacuolar-type H+-ATPase subunit F/Vma7
MSLAVAIGDELRLAGYSLVGAEVHHAVSPAEIEAAWTSLDDDVGLVVLTRESYGVLEQRLAERGDLLWAVVPS